MSMYYDFAINDRVVFEDIQGETAADAYDFIEDKFRTVPTYDTYEVDAVEFARYLAERHTPVIDENDNAAFPENDTFYYEEYRHFGNDAESMDPKAACDAFKNAEILFGIQINNNTKLKITIS